MKLTSMLLLGACLQVAAHVHSQTVSFTGKNVPLEIIFASVEKQTGYVFFFDEATLKEARPVTIRAENYPLQLFLSCVLNGQPLKFSFQNKTIIISRKESPPVPDQRVKDTAVQPNPQPMLQGMVIDMDGNTLAGASVTIKETGKSTITDGRGVFHVAAPAKSKVIVSYVGYTTKEVVLSEKQSQLVVQLSVAVNTLDEEVVQAYGKTSQRLAVGSIVQVSGEEIQKQPVMNPLMALNGRVPGLMITPTSGYVSAPVKAEIRGRNTINQALVSDPLYVIDGVPLTILDINTSFSQSNYKNGSTGFFQAGLFSNTMGQSPLFSINPADIESISVLKDAAATAIYGSRGANGVIIITTKRTKPGKTRLNINVQQGVSNAPRHWDQLNTEQYLQMRREAMKNDGYAASINNMPELAWDTTRSTDWQKELWGVAKSTDVSVGLTGGDRLTSFNLGAGYTQSQDITTLSGNNKRISISSRLTHHTPNQKLTVDLSAIYTYTHVKAITVPNAITLAPNAPPVFDEKGNLSFAEWNGAGLATTAFPFSSVLVPSSNNVNFINASLRLNYNLVKGLSVSIVNGYSNAQSNTFTTNPIVAQNPVFDPKGIASFGNSAVTNLNIEPQVNYVTYIGSGKLDCMAGGSYQYSADKGTTLVGTGYTNDNLLQSISNAPMVSSGQQVAEKKYASIHGRINYNWLNKYILELAGNRDGSSNFGPGRQFGNFWSAGGAWIASEEDWAKQILPSWWSYLKLNASYGITGLDAGAAYQYLSNWTGLRDYSGSPMLYNGVVPMIPQNAVNQDFQWQVNKKTNIDLSMGFLSDRITLTLSWYNNQCNNQLTKIPTPSYTGFSTVMGNSPANVRNRGWEGSVNAELIKLKNFSWALGFNISLNNNKLLSYPDFELSPFYTSQKIGHSLNTVYLFHYLGVNPQNGRRSYEDYNKDGVVAQASGTPPGTLNDDRYISLDLTPKYNGGFSSRFSYKNCDLSLFFIFRKQMAQVPYLSTAGAMGNIPQEVFDGRWKKPGDQALYPRFTTLTTTSDSQFGASDGSYADNSFLRLTNLSFSWSLAENICKKLHMQGVMLSVNANNLFTITRYKGIDPETTVFGILPQPRIIAGKVSFNF